MRTAYCYGRPGEAAFTIKSDGSNLPDAHTWKAYTGATGALSIEVGDTTFSDPEVDQLDREILNGLQTDGFSIIPAERALRRIHVADS